MKNFQTVPPRPEAVDVPLSRLAADVRAIVARQRQQQELAALDDYRAHLPVDHPYRHMLDSVDVACARMVCAPAEPCSCPPEGGTA